MRHSPGGGPGVEATGADSERGPQGEGCALRFLLSPPRRLQWGLDGGKWSSPPGSSNEAACRGCQSLQPEEFLLLLNGEAATLSCLPRLLHKKQAGPGSVTRLVEASSSAPKGCGFGFRSGHTPRLRVQSPVGMHTGGNGSVFLSHICVPLS